MKTLTQNFEMIAILGVAALILAFGIYFVIQNPFIPFV